MIYGVELVFGDQPHEVGKLEGGDAVRLEQYGESGHEIIDVGAAPA